jgi:hypothetical protein
MVLGRLVRGTLDEELKGPNGNMMIVSYVGLHLQLYDLKYTNRLNPQDLLTFGLVTPQLMVHSVVNSTLDLQLTRSHCVSKCHCNTSSYTYF